MRILHIASYYAPAWSYGGVVRAVSDLTRAQAAAGHDITVLTTDTLSVTERTTTRHEQIDGVDVIRVRNLSNALRGRLNLSTPRGIGRETARLIREKRIEVVHVHEVRTVENRLAAPAAQRAGVPVLVSPHGTITYDAGRSGIKRQWDRWVGPRVLPYIDGVIALTNTEAAEARAHWQTVGVPLAEHAIYTAPNGVHAEDFAALPAGEPFRTRWKLGDGPVVIFLGRLHARKGLHLLIPAFAEAVRQTPDARLLIAGPDEGMLARLQSLVSDHDLTGRVIFTGMISGQDKLAALAAADVFALPAVGEGFSMAVLEAMACALPVLLTPGCNFPEAAGEGAGLVVQREIAPLAKGLHHLLTDDERRASMGRRARELVHERYTWPQVVVQLEAIYQDAVRRRHEHA